ncbi:MAG: hypothetical protein PHX74_10710 [Candidatus Sumerlaeales bacterium]|nr:hypothetical protein [Candidatus Sumerlaeales bacterium]
MPVTHKEALYAVQAADAMLFFKKKDIEQIITASEKPHSTAATAGFWIGRAKTNLEIDHKSVNLPIDQYLGENAVDELPKGSDALDKAKKYQDEITAAFTAEKFDPKTVVGLWAKKQLGHD